MRLFITIVDTVVVVVPYGDDTTISQLFDRAQERYLSISKNLGIVNNWFYFRVKLV